MPDRLPNRSDAYTELLVDVWLQHASIGSEFARDHQLPQELDGVFFLRRECDEVSVSHGCLFACRFRVGEPPILACLPRVSQQVAQVIFEICEINPALALAHGDVEVLQRGVCVVDDPVRTSDPLGDAVTFGHVADLTVDFHPPPTADDHVALLDGVVTVIADGGAGRHESVVDETPIRREHVVVEDASKEDLPQAEMGAPRREQSRIETLDKLKLTIVGLPAGEIIVQLHRVERSILRSHTDPDEAGRAVGVIEDTVGVAGPAQRDRGWLDDSEVLVVRHCQRTVEH